MRRLPTRDVPLPDGRILRWRVPPAVIGPSGLAWRADDGLEVRAGLTREPGAGTVLRISVAFPDRAPEATDVEAVGAAFFPPGTAVRRLRFADFPTTVFLTDGQPVREGPDD